MLEVPIYNTAGEKTGSMAIDEARLGGSVNVHLLKQAVMIYNAHQHQGTAANKGRGQVAGSTRKLFRQKGTGNARRGNIRTNIMRGGGVAFAKSAHKDSRRLPRTMRRRALESAVLAKILGQDLLVVEGLSVAAPKTKYMAGVLAKLSINRSCLLALAQRDEALYKSARNLPDVTVRIADELNAFEVATRQKLLMTREAVDALLEKRPTP